MDSCIPSSYQPIGGALSFYLFLTIFYPIFTLFAIFIFYWFQNQSVFTRKRSLNLILISACGGMLNWIDCPLYYVVGAEKFPCALFLFCSYMSAPVLLSPMILKLLKYYNEIAGVFLAQAARRDIRSSTPQDLFVVFEETQEKKLSILQLFTSHIRAIAGNREHKHRIRSASFAKTKSFAGFYILLFGSPYLIAYFIRLNSYQIQNCTGCEFELVDTIFLLCIYLASFLLGVFLNHPRMMKRDSFMIISECFAGWIFGFIAIISMILLLIDPGQVMALNYFNWRVLTIFTPMMCIYVQTIHQVMKARWQKEKLMLSPNIGRDDRLRDVMQDREMKANLQRHLTRELSDEILSFLEAVDYFKENFDKKHANTLAEKIFEIFIQRKSPKEINVGSELRDELLENRHKLERNMFDKAYEEVKKNLLDDGFARFLQKMKNTARASDLRVVAVEDMT